MAGNYVMSGDVITATASGAVASGDVVLVGKFLGVALTSAANGQTYQLKKSGIFQVPKKNGDAFAQGDYVLWDNVAKHFKIGNGGPSAACAKAVAGSATTMLVNFTGVPGL